MTPRGTNTTVGPETHPEAPQSHSVGEAQPEAQPEPPLGPGHPHRALTYGQFQEGVDAILKSVLATTLEVDTTPLLAQAPGSPMIYGQMAKVLAEMPPVPKAQENRQQGFAFQGVDDILDNLNPVLGRHSVFFVPVVEERVAEARQTKGGGTMWTVHLRVRYTFYAADGSNVSAVSWGEGTDTGDKATSKAMTMAMKSMLRQVFAISDNEDPDATSEPTDPVPAKVPLSDEDRASLQEQIDGLSEQAQKVLKALWIDQKGALPSLKNASEEHVPAILALIAEAETLAEQAERDLVLADQEAEDD